MSILKNGIVHEASKKSMSAACFHHSDTQQPTHRWLMGIENSSSADGVFYYRHKMPDLEFIRSQNPIIKALHSIMRLSGFFHDDGKAIYGFQGSLDSNSQGKHPEINAIRHEVISAVQLYPLLEEGGFARISTPEKVREYFTQGMMAHYENFVDQSVSYNESLKKAKLIEHESSAIASILTNTSPEIERLISVENWEKKPLLQSLIYLVLTHHKLPNGQVGHHTKKNGPRSTKVEYMKPVMDVYFKQQPHPDIRSFLKISDAAPWMSDEWCEGVANAACRAMEAEAELTNSNILNSIEWSSALLYLARPSLILADYNASFNKKVCKKQNPKEIVYANTIEKDGKTLWADSLVDHQIKVGELADELYEHLVMRSNSVVKQAQHIKPSEKPRQLENPDNPGEDSSFYWQYAISTELKKKDIQAGFFGVLMSKTGAGKTKAAPQIMCSLSGNTRFNIALGMRTLTMQTYNAYVSDLIGFKKSQVALMIGSGGILDKEINDSNGSANHRDNDEHDYDYLTESHAEIHPLMDSMLSIKQKKRLNTPISVMTVDHLIQATSQQIGAHTTLLPELMSSDLVLDEIDDYSPEDLIALSKLIFLTGFYGRKVILSSATSSSTMIEELQDSYIHGYSMYKSRYDAPDALIAYMSHEAPYLNCCAPSDAKVTYEKFIKNLSDKTRSITPRHIAKIVPISKKTLWLDIYKSCRDFGERYFETDESTGIDVSIGFVRFNNTRNSSVFAKYLLDMPDQKDTAIFTQNYHSKMDDATRYILEGKMNTLLSRKNNDNFMSNAQIRSCIHRAKNEGKRKVVIIISTTNIQETGRDHDYDWAIVEPHSDKSVIQCAGRVWRHRHNKAIDNGANIGILSCPINVFQRPETCWSYPGVETSTNETKIEMTKIDYKVNVDPASNITHILDEIGITHNGSLSQTHVETATSALARDLFSHGITAAPAISPIIDYKHARMASVEQCKLHRLIGRQVANQSLSEFGMSGFFVNGSVMLTQRHPQVRSFRHRSPNATEICVSMNNPLSGFIGFNWEVTIEGLVRNYEVIQLTVDDPYDRIFIHIEQKDAVIALCSEFGITDEESAKKIASGTFTDYKMDKKTCILHSSFFGYDAT
jgi:CRISPR-associated endonuclease/helicase Cas3